MDGISCCSHHQREISEQIQGKNGKDIVQGITLLSNSIFSETVFGLDGWIVQSDHRSGGVIRKVFLRSSLLTFRPH